MVVKGMGGVFFNIYLMFRREGLIILEHNKVYQPEGLVSCLWKGLDAIFNTIINTNNRKHNNNSK